MMEPMKLLPQMLLLPPSSPSSIDPIEQASLSDDISDAFGSSISYSTNPFSGYFIALNAFSLDLFNSF